MKINKPNHPGSRRRKCPPGMVMVNGKCIRKNPKDKNGFRLMPDAPTRGLVLSEDRCVMILKTHSVFCSTQDFD